MLKNNKINKYQIAVFSPETTRMLYVNYMSVKNNFREVEYKKKKL